MQAQLEALGRARPRAHRVPGRARRSRSRRLGARDRLLRGPACAWLRASHDVAPTVRAALAWEPRSNARPSSEMTYLVARGGDAVETIALAAGDGALAEALFAGRAFGRACAASHEMTGRGREHRRGAGSAMAAERCGSWLAARRPRSAGSHDASTNRHAVDPAGDDRALAQASCTTSLRPGPDLGHLYDRAAQSNDAQRNPIIVIPRRARTVLRDKQTGRIVWGTFVGTYADPRRAEGAQLVALPMQLGTPLGELHDEVAPDGVLESVKVRPARAARRAARLHLDPANARRRWVPRPGSGPSVPSTMAPALHVLPVRLRLASRQRPRTPSVLHEFILEKKSYVERELKQRYGSSATSGSTSSPTRWCGLLASYYLRYGAADLPADGGAPQITWAGAQHVAPTRDGRHAQRGLARRLDRSGRGHAARFLPATLFAHRGGTIARVYELLPRTRQRCGRR
jgi:hypothetical protein